MPTDSFHRTGNSRWARAEAALLKLSRRHLHSLSFSGSRAGLVAAPHDLALLAFDARLPIPESTVRAALRASVQSIVMHAEKDNPPPADPAERGDWAAAVAERELTAHARSTVVPLRMHRIDQQLGEWVPWPHEAVAQFDKGPSTSEPMTAVDLDLLAGTTLLAGEELTAPIMAQFIRAIGPAGAASPAASTMEFDGVDFTTIIGSVVGMRRMMIRDALRDRRPTVMGHAAAAVGMLRTGLALRLLYKAIPDGNFNLIPALLPPCMYRLAGLPEQPKTDSPTG